VIVSSFVELPPSTDMKSSDYLSSVCILDVAHQVTNSVSETTVWLTKSKQIKSKAYQEINQETGQRPGALRASWTT